MNKEAHIKAAIAAAFSAAAGSYDAAAGVQRRVAGELAQRIARLPLDQPRVLEIGCGTGFLSRELLALDPRELLLTDIAPTMIGRCRATLARLARQLAPGGTLAFATLATDSFREWRDAHEVLGLTAATRTYPSVAALRTMLPGLHVEDQHLTHHSATGHTFLAQLRQIGAHLPEIGHKPLSAGALRSVLRRFAGGIDVTYHVAFGPWTRS